MKSKMILIVAAVVLGISLFSWYRYNQYRFSVLENEIQIYKEAYERADLAMNELIEHNKKQAKELTSLYNKYYLAESRAKELQILLSSHNLEELAHEKPGLIQNRINKGTEEVLSELEEITRIK